MDKGFFFSMSMPHKASWIIKTKEMIFLSCPTNKSTWTSEFVTNFCFVCFFFFFWLRILIYESTDNKQQTRQTHLQLERDGLWMQLDKFEGIEHFLFTLLFVQRLFSRRYLHFSNRFLPFFSCRILAMISFSDWFQVFLCLKVQTALSKFYKTDRFVLEEKPANQRNKRLLILILCSFFFSHLGLVLLMSLSKQVFEILEWNGRFGYYMNESFKRAYPVNNV